ncbi:hypothetical protein CC80DRAFT_15248 [Byssothecium circinans]|uniref:Uncharacterized protein n=1 Tax=Byssothecium circinans TaxID=147558 RepID=A0A6A5UBY5_9PLEO|nr:hypothetical protein CC80DRAFT_15248 [Byssothecium circinans]
MLPTYAFYLSLVSILASPAMASPIDTLASLQCSCLTFHAYAQPAACTMERSQNLSWPAAQSFASAHHLDITFVSPTTVSRVLEVEQPLPTSVLMSMYGSRGRARQETGSRIVCGAWDEVKRKYLVESVERSKVVGGEGRRCDGLVSEIVGILLLMLMVYAVGEYVWSRFVGKPGEIQLQGSEKDLLAFAEAGEISIRQPELNEKSAQTESSVQTDAS